MKEKIIRTVPLDRATLVHAQTERKKIDTITEAIADLFEELCDRKIKREDDFWEAMRIKADAKPEESLRINWIASQIEILEKE